MRSSLAAAFLLLCALSVSANTITSISPNLVKVNSGEHFLTVYGTTLGNRIVFENASGSWTINATAQFSGSIVGWVPEAVVMKSGVYNVYVLDSRGGKSNTVSFTVQGFKYFPLAILTPEALLIQAKSREGADATYEVIAIGSEDPRPVVSCSPKSGTFFKFGVTRVTCNATSADGQKASAEFTVQIADMMEPILKLPEERIVVEPKDQFGAIVEFETFATDEIYGEITPDCFPRSGSLFPIGNTTVTCTATDNDLNTASGQFDVTVLGDVPEPLEVVVPPGITEKAFDAKGAVVRYEVSVKNSKGKPVVECSPASDSLFPLGTTTVVCNAWDDLGARGVGDFSVDVIDPSAPDIVRLTISEEKLPNDRRLYPLTLDVTAVDDIDMNPVCMVVDVTSNETLDLPGDGDKDTYDYAFTDFLALELRGEANEKDRWYDIHVDCVDFFGNIRRGTTQVFVGFNNTGSTTTTPQPTKRRAAGR